MEKIIKDGEEEIVIKLVKVRYSLSTTLVIGYYPAEIRYPNNNIDQVNKTIDGDPYIEVDEDKHKSILGKTMCVIEGDLQEYVKPMEEALADIRDAKSFEVQLLRKDEQYLPYEYNGVSFKATESAQQKLSAVSELEHVVWFSVDMSAVELTRSNLRDIKKGIYNRSFKLYDKEYKIKKRMNSITDLEVLNAFNIEEEWKKTH